MDGSIWKNPDVTLVLPQKCTTVCYSSCRSTTTLTSSRPTGKDKSKENTGRASNVSNLFVTLTQKLSLKRTVAKNPYQDIFRTMLSNNVTWTKFVWAYVLKASVTNKLFRDGSEHPLEADVASQTVRKRSIVFLLNNCTHDVNCHLVVHQIMYPWDLTDFSPWCLLSVQK